jgi:hypothetical protein
MVTAFGGCGFANNPQATARGEALVVTVSDTHGNSLGGAKVQLTLSSGFASGTISTDQTSVSNGSALFPSLSRQVSPSTDTGSVFVSASFSRASSASVQVSNLAINVVH